MDVGNESKRYSAFYNAISIGLVRQGKFAAPDLQNNLLFATTAARHASECTCEEYAQRQSHPLANPLKDKSHVLSST